MKRFAALILTMCILLTGCGWFRGSYVSITRHENTGSEPDSGVVSIDNYEELCAALETMLREGQQNSIIHTANYSRDALEADMDAAMDYIRHSSPFGAYTVEDIRCELGINGVTPAIAVEIEYRHTGAELRNILEVRDMDMVEEQLGLALERCDSALVMLVQDYSDADLQQAAEDYAKAHPDTIMEIPRITQETYPQTGSLRILEMRLAYQNSRDDLRMMQAQTAPVFASAALYVSGNESELTTFTQLYAFLKERFTEYQIKTSITPSYSLLRHGVGDNEAFASVYARMCHRAGLECHMVNGSCNGEAWVWNMVCCDGSYFHLDLLDPEGTGGIRLKTDAQMENYVWDYSAYPSCVAEEPVPETANTTLPPEDPTQDTVPVTEAPVPESTETEPPEETQLPQETTQPTESSLPETEAENKK